RVSKDAPSETQAMNALKSDGSRNLQRVRAFPMELVQGSWFAACGEPPLPAECAESARYLAGLGFGAPAISGVASWSEAAAIAQRRDWDRGWWEAEERGAQDLKRAGIAAFGETQLLAALSAVAEASAALHGHAALAAARAGVADPALSRVAAGAAAMA